MNNSTVVALLFAVALVSTSAQAQGVNAGPDQTISFGQVAPLSGTASLVSSEWWTVNASGSLVKVIDGVPTIVGPTSYSQVGDLVNDGTVVYGVAADPGAQQLFTLNPATGATTVLATYGSQREIRSLALDRTSPRHLYAIDMANEVLVEFVGFDNPPVTVVEIGQGLHQTNSYPNIRSLTYRESTDSLWAVSVDTAGVADQTLLTISPATGLATEQGAIPSSGEYVEELQTYVEDVNFFALTRVLNGAQADDVKLQKIWIDPSSNPILKPFVEDVGSSLLATSAESLIMQARTRWERIDGPGSVWFDSRWELSTSCLPVVPHGSYDYELELTVYSGPNGSTSVSDRMLLSVDNIGSGVIFCEGLDNEMTTDCPCDNPSTGGGCAHSATPPGGFGGLLVNSSSGGTSVTGCPTCGPVADLQGSSMPPDKNGLLLMSGHQLFSGTLPTAGSKSYAGLLGLAVGGTGIKRLSTSTTDGNGNVVLGNPVPLAPGSSPILAGSTWYFQYQFRDPGFCPQRDLNYTNGFAITFTP